MTNEDRFVCGYVAACADMLSMHHNDTEVRDCLENIFKSTKDLKEKGVDDYDIELLKPIIKEILRKRKSK